MSSIGSLNDVLASMENGVYDFTVGGKCSECGQCCTALLPMNDEEIARIKKYIKTHNIKPHAQPAFLAEPVLDLTCPFLNDRKDKHKCEIYPVRPDICKHFVCNVPPSKVQEDKAKFWKTRRAVYMWEIIQEEK